MLSTVSKSSVSKQVPYRSIAEPAIAPAAKLGGGFLLVWKKIIIKIKVLSIYKYWLFTCKKWL